MFFAISLSSVRYNLLHAHQHDKFLNTLVNDKVTSPAPFSIVQTRTISWNKSGTFSPRKTIPDSATAFASPERDNYNYLKMSNTINADSYIDLVYEKYQIVKFKNEILQSLLYRWKKQWKVTNFLLVTNIFPLPIILPG